MGFCCCSCCWETTSRIDRPSDRTPHAKSCECRSLIPPANPQPFSRTQRHKASDKGTSCRTHLESGPGSVFTSNYLGILSNPGKSLSRFYFCFPSVSHHPSPSSLMDIMQRPPALAIQCSVQVPRVCERDFFSGPPSTRTN